MTEGERIIRIETQMDNIEKKIDGVSNILEKFIEQSEKRFASKWVEKVLWGIGAIIGTAFLVSIISLVIIQK